MENEQDKTLEIVSSDALERIERAQVDIQIATAKEYPRDMALVKKDMLSLATLDTETAESCFYTLRRKEADGSQKLIQGPSARLAEIAVNAFGNINAGARIIGNDGKMITAQAVCHDMQKNVRISIEVKRRITNKQGKTFSEDMQVVTGNAACSIALRNAVFKVIPMALVKPVYDQAKKVAAGDAKTLASRRDAVIARFVELGISKERVFAAIGVTGMEGINLEKLELLIGMGTAIKEDPGAINELFPDPKLAPKPSTPAPSLFGAGSGRSAGAPHEDEQKPEPPGKIEALEELLGQMSKDGVTESALIYHMHEGGMIENSLSTLAEVAQVAPSTIEAVLKGWKTIRTRVSKK